MGARLRLPPSSLPGPWAPPAPRSIPPRSRLQAGPWDLRILPPSRLAWESPSGPLIVLLLPLFLCLIVPVISILHAAAAAREGMAAAEAVAEARGQGPGVRVAALPAQSGPPGLPQSLQWVHGRRLGSLQGILVLDAQGEGQETLSLPPHHFQLSYLEPQAALPSRSIKADALHSQNLASVSFWLGAGLPALLTGPYKAEEMKVCEVSRLDESRPNKAEPSQSVLGEEGLEGGRRNLAFGLHRVRIF